MLFCICLCLYTAFAIHCDPSPTPNKPIGKAKGINPGRVVWVHDPTIANWNGSDGYWMHHVNATRTSDALVKSLLHLTGAQSPAMAWKAILRGYTPGDGVAIKVNMNNHELSYAISNANGLSPQYLYALVTQLVEEAGVVQQDIAIYDAARGFSDPYFDPIHAKYPRVRMVDHVGINGRVKVAPDMTKVLYFSNDKVPAFNGTHVPACATQSRFHITVDNLRGHDIAGFTASAKNYFGAIWRPECHSDSTVCDCDWPWGNTQQWCPRDLHEFVSVTRNAMGSYTPLVDLLGYFRGTDLWLCDGIMGGPTEHADPPVLFESPPFNGHWSSSVFASQDPVALDSVLYDILRFEPNVPCAHKGCIDNYLHEAALAPSSPSGTQYRPDGPSSPPLDSLGVHEHWDSNETRRYTRNLGTGDGIELVEI